VQLGWVDPADYGTWLKKEIESYLEYQMGLHQLLDEIGRDKTIAHFKGPYLEFTRIPKKSVTPAEYAAELDSIGIKLDQSLVMVLSKWFKSLYAHQTTGIQSLLEGKNVVLPHPTGSGKTEIFMIPVLNYILQQISSQKYGLGCVLVYPMKALENDQRDRLKRFLYDLELEGENKIPRIGVYDGDTPNQSDFEIRGTDDRTRAELKKYREVCPKCQCRTLAFNMGKKSHLLRCEEFEDYRGIRCGCGYPEDREDGIPWLITTREGMRQEHFPNILITNPESLDFRLLTPEDEGVFRTKMPKVVVVVDEAHAYSGEAALSLRVFLSRLEEKIRKVNGNPDISFQYILSSATLESPEEFAKNLLPWIDSVVVKFEEQESILTSPNLSQWKLSSPIECLGDEEINVALEANGSDNPNSVFSTHGFSLDQSAKVLSTLIQFGVLEKEDQKYRVTVDLQQAAVSYELGRKTEASKIASDWLSKRFSELQHSRDLYAKIRAKPCTLDELVDWWIKQWHWTNRDEVRYTILSLIRMGRSLAIWEERWHFFVRSPGGIALCSNNAPHHYQESVDVPFPKICGCGYPFFETWTCQDCGEIYLKAYSCESCGTIHANPTESCCPAGVPPYKPVIIPRASVKGLKSVPTKGVPTLSVTDPECPICSGGIRPIRRRTDLTIEVSTSLMAWKMEDEAKRKFLLFNDSRASSERIAREFNNLEVELWTERLVMDLMLRDSDHDKFASRKYNEIRRKMFTRAYKPYYALKGLLRPLEWDLFEAKISRAGFKALGKSVSGPSRLFEHGLLAYDIRSLSTRLSALDIAEIAPRLLDIIRMKASFEKGIKKERLFDSFIGESGGANAGFTNYCRNLVKWDPSAKAHNDALDLALQILMNSNWIRRISVSGKEYFLIREGQDTSEDPFSNVSDPRLLRVPDSVWFCDTCGSIKWYKFGVCEHCGHPMREISHDELIRTDYFAEVMTRAPRPVVAAVHRAGLRPLERRILEERFSAREESIHFLSSTPTLELGIDIGLLSYVMLAGVPPTRSSYIQRVGRAGRRSGGGAICSTFCYPSPVDAFYFRNPEPLVSMRASRIPVQSVTPNNVLPLIWTVSFDSLSVETPSKIKDVLSGRTKTRSFLSKEMRVKPEDLIGILESEWDRRVSPWVMNVMRRVLVPGKDGVDNASLISIVENQLNLLSNPTMSADRLLHLSSFNSHVAEVDRIQSSVSSRMAQLTGKSSRTKEENDELGRLEKESASLIEYKKKEMISAPLLNYLHDVGTFCTARGIGSSVEAIDLGQKGGMSIDSRAEGEAVFNYFPGAYVSRQGAQYICRQVVYDPIEKPIIRLCSKCERWLPSGTSVCPVHTQAEVVERTLLLPIVAFAGLFGREDLETQANRKRKVGTLEGVADKYTLDIGALRTHWSLPSFLKVADYAYDYGIRRKGVLQDKSVSMIRCRSCLEDYRDGGCCGTPDPESITQGVLFETSGVRVHLGDSQIMKCVAAEKMQLALAANRVGLDPNVIVSQTLCNALLNSVSIVLDIEPSVLDAVVDEHANIWIYEPVSGGSGLMANALSDQDFLSKVAARVKDLVETKPDHDCARYCDQCLIVPRFSHDELELLNRRVLEMLIAGV
jgi:hypothetical protein